MITAAGETRVIPPREDPALLARMREPAVLTSSWRLRDDKMLSKCEAACCPPHSSQLRRFSDMRCWVRDVARVP